MAGCAVDLAGFGRACGEGDGLEKVNDLHGIEETLRQGRIQKRKRECVGRAYPRRADSKAELKRLIEEHEGGGGNG